MTTITRGSGNALVDLGIENAEELTTKIQLAVAIKRILKGRHLKQAEAAELLGIPQSKVSNLMNAKLDGFSVERLMKLLTLLNRDIEIRVKKAPRGRRAGRILVEA